ncbi:MAG: ion transporter [Actinobacteria bacterium]|jgi:voltage-gated potassium channel|nr:ion transporter [Actinomycetota bacterium]
MSHPVQEAAEAGAAHQPSGLKNPGYEIFIALLSILSILNLVLMYVIQDPDLDYVLMIMNAPLTLIFFIDFLYRFKTAPDRRYYFWRNWGWADLLASLPFEQTKILRVFRLVKVYRLLKEYGARAIGRAILKDRAGSALLMLLFIGILVLEFGSLAMLRLESDVEGANITSASDAIWYIVVTMATVGYGDEYPITNAGRVVGTGIIVVGVGIFGTLTGYLANLFLSPPKSPENEAGAVPDVQHRLDALKDLVTQQQKAIAELETILEGKAP